MREIRLTQGQVALVDDEDYEWLSQRGWYALWNPTSQSFYAQRSVSTGLEYPKRRPLLMHNAIWEHHNGLIQAGVTVDHEDRNTLDDCLSNLRLATPSQQMQNRGLRRDNASGYRGVHWHKQSGRWRAQIRVDGKAIHLGNHSDPIEAAYAYDAAVRIHHDPSFAQPNFTDDAPGGFIGSPDEPIRGEA